MELRDYIRLILTAGSTVDHRTVEEIGVISSRAAVTGAFVTAVERRFEDTPSHADIAEVVARIREHYVAREALPPMLGEALVRIAFGDESLVEGISDDELLRGQLLMTYGMVHDLGLEGGSFEGFLSEATERAEELLAEESSSS